MTPRATRTAGHGIEWILAILLSASWHVLWLPRDGPRKTRFPTPPPPRMASLAFHGESNLRDPLLFSLRPTGWARREDPANGISRPPLSAPPPAPVIVHPTVPAVRPPDGLPLPITWTARAPAPEDPAMGKDVSFPRLPAGPPLEIEPRPPWDVHPPIHPPLPELFHTPQSWTAVAWFHFDEAGLPMGILIESENLPPEFRHPLRVALQAWRLPREIPERSGAVRIRRDGPLPEPGSP